MGNRPARRRISRRRTLALLGASVSGLVSVSACGQPSSSGPAITAPTTVPTVVASAQVVPSTLPTTAPASTQTGGGDARTGALRLLFWQAPTILNPHLGRGIPDSAAARCCF